MSVKTLKIFLCYVPAFCRRENVSNQQEKKNRPTYIGRTRAAVFIGD